MYEEEKVYRELQQHLDRQAVAFPAAQSGAEIRILKRLFKPEEARLATHLSYKPRSVQQIYETVKASGISLKDMEHMLDAMMKNGVIELIEREGTRYFSNLPFIVGIYERQLYKFTPESLAEFEEYSTGLDFGLAFLNSGMSQMRTIPVEASIPFDRHVTTYDHLTEIISETNGPFAVVECTCRKAASMKGNPCKKTSRIETCLSLGNWAKFAIRSGQGRVISKEEAIEITRQNEADGLVLQPSNTQKVEFICACCGCCCGMLSAHKMLPKPIDFWSSNYYVAINSETCNECGVCIERCQVNALNIDEGLGIAVVNLDRCIGCGNCVAPCPLKAISLLKKEKEIVPPVDSESLYDTIMTKRKGR
jgi:NAD-dependent dihydropyrimidine dehydrogenase PreA subunit